MNRRSTAHGLLMRAFVLCLIAIAGGSGSLLAQNLVVNPSFELRALCPAAWGDFSPPSSVLQYVLNWQTATTGGSPDYYNACAATCGSDVPDNRFGTEPAHHGDAYAGIIIGDNGTFREYVTVNLSTPLTAGVRYRVSFWASLADIALAPQQPQTASGKLGALVANIPGFAPLGGTGLYPPAAPPNHLVEATFIVNNINGWRQITGTFTATGGENRIIIGCFEPVPSGPVPAIGTLAWPCPPNGILSHSSYYYIDDVSLTAESCVSACNADLSWRIVPHANNGPESCCYDIYIRNDENCDVHVPYGMMSYYMHTSTPVMNDIQSFTNGTWTGTMTSDPLYGDIRVVWQNPSNGNYLPANTETYVGSVCLTPDDPPRTMSVGIFTNSTYWSSWCKGSGVTVDCARDCCDDLNVQLVSTSSPGTNRCDWDVVLTQSPQTNCIYGVRITGISVDWQTSPGSTGLNLTSGLTVGHVYLTHPTGAIALATVTVEILDQYGNVVCTRTFEKSCGPGGISDVD